MQYQCQTSFLILLVALGGPETQTLFDAFAAAPPSSEIDKVDKRSCGYCKKPSAEKLKLCSRCNNVAYCNQECQKAAWKGHKTECKKKVVSGSPAKAGGKLPLTWAQLEAFGAGVEATGKVLEVRALNEEGVVRQVMVCKDRDGVLKRIAAYTASRRIPGLVPGAVLRWKNPKFHYFLDGSSGARIEDQDSCNITIET